MSNSMSALGVFPQEYLYALHGSQYNAFEQTCDTVAQLRGLVGVPGMQVFVRGIVTAGDGGAGPFWWSATSMLADDGQNVIVPSSPFQQPGAWLRLVISGANGAVFKNISALTSFPIAPPGVIFSGTLGATASVQGYTNPGDNGGGIFDLIATSRTADNVVAFSVSGQSGFKWIRRYDLGSLTFEMAGAVGDYSFVTDNAAGGTATFTDNTAAFNAFFAAFNHAQFTAGNTGNAGIMVRMRPGKAYLLRSNVTMTNCGYIHIVGAGHNRLNYGVNFPEWLAAGSAIVLDVANGATQLAPWGETHLQNFLVLRRNLPLNPTGLQCIGFYGTSGGSWNDGSVGVRCDSVNTPAKNGAHMRLDGLVVIGFGTGILVNTTTTDVYDCHVDCYNGFEFTGIGDTARCKNSKALPYMGIAVPNNDPNKATARAHAGIGLNVHDRADTFDCDGVESENWTIGYRLSNLTTSPRFRFGSIECNGNAGDIGIKIENWCASLRLSQMYVGNNDLPISINAVQWDFASPQPTEGSAGTASDVTITDCNLVGNGTNGQPVVSIGGDYCCTTIRGMQVYPNAADLFHVAALVSGRAGPPRVHIDDWNILQTAAVDAIVVDPTMQKNVYINNVFEIGNGKQIVPPGNTIAHLGTSGAISGRWYGPSTVDTTLVPTAGSLYAFPFEVGALSKIINIGVNVTATTGGSIRIGIYADNAGVPGARLYDSGIVSVGATGGITPGTEPSITPSTSPFVWLAVVAGATSTPTLTAFSQITGTAEQNLALGATSLANAAANTWVIGYVSGSYSDTTLATALPATFGTTMGAGGIIPSVFVGF